MASFVKAIFFDRTLKANVVCPVKIPASTAGSSSVAKIACNDVAWGNGYTHYALCDPVTKAWLVFACGGRSKRMFLARLPTQEAAEMWLVHRGG